MAAPARRARQLTLLLAAGLSVVAATSTSSAAGRPDLARDLGQMVIAPFAGTSPPASLLAHIHAGQIGGVILFASNTSGGVAATHTLVARLQAAARSGGNPGLLVMTDQEGGEVNRLAGPPTLSASQMGSPAVAAAQGRSTATLLRAAGVNVDLAPVADVARVQGFIAQERRSFGTTAQAAAPAACAFADALADGGVAYTLKHFPGLGSAIDNTDLGPVSVGESLDDLRADDAAYRRCGHGARVLVMISNASYPALTGTTPAVLSPVIYSRELPRDGVDAVTISDDLQAGALAEVSGPARTAINAGLDLLLYGRSESTAETAYRILLSEAREGLVSQSRIESASRAILALKRSLRLLG